MYSENELSNIVIREAIHVHKRLGPGLLESIYEACMCYRLSKAGLFIVKQKPIPVVFEEVRMECRYRADIVVENKMIVEIKSVDALNEVHKAQVLTYLRLSDIKLGLLVNFNVLFVKEGIRRVVNNL